MGDEVDRAGKARRITGARFTLGSEELAYIEIPVGTDLVFPDLSSEENTVCSHVLAGLSNEEIARVRAVSSKTVENQIASIFRKLEVFSRAELVVLALERSRHLTSEG